MGQPSSQAAKMQKKPAGSARLTRVTPPLISPPDRASILAYMTPQIILRPMSFGANRPRLERVNECRLRRDPLARPEHASETYFRRIISSECHRKAPETQRQHRQSQAPRRGVTVRLFPSGTRRGARSKVSQSQAEPKDLPRREGRVARSHLSARSGIWPSMMSTCILPCCGDGTRKAF